MADNSKDDKYTTSQLLNFAPNSYLERTSRPIYAIFFLLPFIVLYELGTMFVNTELLDQSQIRVVAFVWLQNFMALLGLGKRTVWVGAPLVAVVVLLALQITSRKRWSYRPKDALAMAVECVILALPLIAFSLLLNRPAVPQQAWLTNNAVQTGTPNAFFCVWEPLQLQTYARIHTSPLTSGTDNLEASQDGTAEKSAWGKTFWVRLITGIGAGIYEELIFRLILICLLMLLLQDVMGLAHNKSVVLAVIFSALCFSLHHHIYLLNGQIESGEPFYLPAFIFRILAGIYFAALFAVRGFAITAGTHTFYNIIAALFNNVTAG